MATTITFGEFAKICQITPVQLYRRALHHELPFDAFGNQPLAFENLRLKFTYDDALLMETTRQLSKDDGLSLKVAAKIVAGAKSSRANSADGDVWIGMIFNQNSLKESQEPGAQTSDNESGDEQPVQIVGNLSDVCRAIQEKSTSSVRNPTRIFLVNVGAASRQLEARARLCGFAVKDGAFVRL